MGTTKTRVFMRTTRVRTGPSDHVIFQTFGAIIGHSRWSRAHVMTSRGIDDGLMAVVDQSLSGTPWHVTSVAVYLFGPEFIFDGLTCHVFDGLTWTVDAGARELRRKIAADLPRRYTSWGKMYRGHCRSVTKSERCDRISRMLSDVDYQDLIIHELATCLRVA